jgi:SAM-dependent methyltransferase
VPCCAGLDETIGAVLYEDRDRAESFGETAALYDRARPGYPPELIDALVGEGACRVLDIGAGTGIASTLLAARGCDVLGVEVDARMAAIARSRGIAVELAAFERWDPRGRRFDLLTSAQAWHWVQPGVGARRAAAVLAGSGRIAVFWNRGGPPEHIANRLRPIYAELEPDLERRSVVLNQRDDRVTATLASLSGEPLLERAEVRRFPWAATYGTSTWIDFLRTHSDHHALPRERRERLLCSLAAAIDALGGAFEVSYETVLVSARRVAGAGT